MNMSKLPVFFINAFFNILMTVVLIILVITEHGILGIVFFVLFILYLLFSDVFFPSIGNIKQYKSEEKHLRKIGINLLYIFLYLISFVMVVYITPAMLVLPGIFYSIDFLSLIFFQKRLLFHLLD